MSTERVFTDPELEYCEESEIEAAIDVTIAGTDNIARPIMINQDENLLQLTLEDAKRLREFLSDAIIFIEEYNGRSVQ